ncbi:MAG: LLM class F420-dependent oxidoreductase [Actinobacteria bacterium]|nr:LLM class F420-dependent oxidoreductase [Actinomycetota bacterium]
MQIGVTLPQTEIGGAVADLRTYAEGVEQLGYGHLVAYEHVVGADPAVYTDWSGPYDIDSTFHEPFVMLGYLAGITKLELAPAVIILPQRQTALVAKQAAEVDLLTEGRFRLGIGLGWNEVEYEALGQDFSTRGRRMDEQVALLRRYWTERSITFEGEFDRVTGAGIAPLPLQRPIPLWFGGGSKPAFRRMGRLADGWLPMMTPGPELDEAMATIAASAEAAGRDPQAIGMEGRITWAGDIDQVRVEADQWRALGATHVSINTMGSGLGPVSAHLEVLAQVAAALELA